MHLRHIALAVLTTSSAAMAQETCELRAAQLFATGRTSELAALFTGLWEPTSAALSTNHLPAQINPV